MIDSVLILLLSTCWMRWTLNWDTQYRQMVARLVRKQADQQTNVQIFCTTFKPEIIEEADSFYRVTLKNEASRIEKTTREEALEFVHTRLSAAPTTEHPTN